MFEIMKSVVAKSKGRASPSSPESVEAELYANVRVNFSVCVATL